MSLTNKFLSWFERFFVKYILRNKAPPQRPVPNYRIPISPGSHDRHVVFVNGVLQEPGFDYSVYEDAIVFDRFDVCEGDLISLRYKDSKSKDSAQKNRGGGSPFLRKWGDSVIEETFFVEMQEDMKNEPLQQNGS